MRSKTPPSAKWTFCAFCHPPNVSSIVNSVTAVKLPGDRGKGTPWCSVAGKFEADGEQYMAGMALCAAKPNSLSQYVIDLPGEWLELLRVYQMT